MKNHRFLWLRNRTTDNRKCEKARNIKEKRTIEIATIRNEVKSLNTQIIAIANQKGGVGKTTTCANLGIGLAQAGKKVLLIDGDPQGSLTISLGNPQPDKLPFTLSDAMGKILMDQPIRPGEGILHHAEGVDLMPADIQLSGMEVSLVNAMSRETVLRQYLDTLKGQMRSARKPRKKRRLKPENRQSAPRILPEGIIPVSSLPCWDREKERDFL